MSHDIAIVGRLCERALMLRHGRVVEQAPTASLVADSREAYTRRLLAAVPHLPVS